MSNGSTTADIVGPLMLVNLSPTFSYKNVYFSLNYVITLCHQVQNKLLSFDAEFEKGRFKGPELRKVNDTKNLLHRPFM